MRLLPILALLGLAACDSSGPDAEPYDGVIEVSLARDADGRAVLHLVTEDDDLGCLPPLVVETDVSSARLGVRVVGVGESELEECLVATPAWADVPLPFDGQGGFSVGVAHRGSADAYTYSIGFAGERLDAVRTATTRLATP